MKIYCVLLKATKTMRIVKTLTIIGDKIVNISKELADWGIGEYNPKYDALTIKPYGLNSINYIKEELFKKLGKEISIFWV
jgi:hypothetical protein